MTISQVLSIPLHNHTTILIAPAPLDAIPLPQLLLACHKHLGHFQRGEESDPRFCLELFRRALDARDPEAWHGLVTLFQPLLLARLRRQEIAADIAEEVVQEAFVTLWLKSDSRAVSTCDRTLAQVLHYLWGSVRFALIKLQRQQHAVSLDPDSNLEPAYTSMGSQSTIERMLDAQALLAHIRKLVTAREWLLLWLRFGQGLPPREIAVQLSIPVDKIHMTLASAKRRIRSDPRFRRYMEMDGSSEE